MFGHDDQSQHLDADQQATDGALTADDQAMGAAAITTDTDAGDYMDGSTGATTSATPVAPSAPVAAEEPAAVVAPSTPVVATATTPVVAPQTDDLLDIKQQALQQLTPLVGHLEQTPEEKFRTTMMMIQASDNSALVKAAYEAAMQITDEKVRAQALLDIVNEINYFTHNDAAAV